MAIPGLLYFLVFRYIPMLGIIIAFKEENIFKSIWETSFVGLKYFKNFLHYPVFWRIFRNTMIIAIYDIVFSFPGPIIVALLLNEVRRKYFKKTLQTVLYLPHFLSWVIVAGIFMSALSPSSGIVNQIMGLFGIEPIYFMAKPKYIRAILISSGIWKELGWGTIIYTAAIAGIDQNLYEAAYVDGAGKLRQAMVITIPGILSTIVVMLLLRIGHILDFGFDRTYVFMNGLNSELIDIFDTYIYRVGLVNSQFSYTTAIGMFKSVIGMTLLLSANKISKSLTEKSLF
ncbi:MAG: ABC transporter permease, partial [Peptococcales bacterium]|jgi:putative aldouronate transport system permease protein